ncbi:MAG: PilZ domain-containing protein [Desulfobacterales bacterium]
MARIIGKRLDERIKYKIPVLVRHDRAGRSYRARITNYSSSGLCIETDMELGVGDKISLDIEDTLDDSSINTFGHYTAKIVWGKKLASSFFKYGYGATDISESVAPQRQVKDLELREYSRKTVYKPVYFYLKKQVREGYIYNLSHGGAFIRTKYKCPAGQAVKLVPAITNIDKGIMLKCEVVHSGRSGFGVKFKSMVKLKEIVDDGGGTRSGTDRREIYTLDFSPDKRSGIDRRNGPDRRKFRFVHNIGLKLSTPTREL